MVKVSTSANECCVLLRKKKEICSHAELPPIFFFPSPFSAPVISLPASLSNLGTMPKDLGLTHAEALGENEVDMEVEDEKKGFEEGREDEKATGTKDKELRESGWENEVNQKEEEEEELLYLLEDDVEEWDE